MFRVIAEDADFLAVDKPEGLPTLPGAGFLENTLLFRVRERFPEAVPMHRLGRGTTGIVLFARTQEARQVIQREWQAGRVSKTYLAVTSGIVPEKADIDVPIGLVPHPILGRIHAASKAGKPSQSHLRRLCVLSPAACRTQQSQSPSPMSLAEVKIDTGRPHQIRIHTAAIGHPLWGDPLYLPGGLPAPDSRNVPGDTGYLLHAFRLAFRHPATGKDVELTVPPPLPRWEAVRLVMPELWQASETI